MHQHRGVVKTSKRNRNSERVSEQADVCCFNPFSSDPLKCVKSLLQGSLSHGCMCLVDHTTSATKIGLTGFSQHFATRLVEWWYNENMSWTKRYLLTFKIGNYNFWLLYMHQCKCHQKAKPESHPLEWGSHQTFNIGAFTMWFKNCHFQLFNKIVNDLWIHQSRISLLLPREENLLLRNLCWYLVICFPGTWLCKFRSCCTIYLTWLCIWKWKDCAP